VWCGGVVDCDFLAGQTPPTLPYLNWLQFAGVLTPLCMQSMSELCACLFGPCWPRYLPPTADDDKLGSLMIIYSGYCYFWLPLVYLSFGFPLCCLQVSKEEKKENKGKKLFSLNHFSFFSLFLDFCNILFILLSQL
jgi:hypothetical protein